MLKFESLVFSTPGLFIFHKFMAKMSRLGVPFGGEGEGMGGMGILGFGACRLFIWNEWAMGSYRTAQGNVCDWVTLLYNRT